METNSPKYGENMTAEEMFIRESNKVKRRNSPSKVNKDAPMFKKKTFKQAMFD